MQTELQSPARGEIIIVLIMSPRAGLEFLWSLNPVVALRSTTGYA
jgi:hypothetical protein